MKALLEWIRKDMKPALGVTEPAAIALACAAARAMTEEPAECLLVRENSGIYKNAFTCGIPGTDKIGNEFAAPWAVWREIRKRPSGAGGDIRCRCGSRKAVYRRRKVKVEVLTDQL